MEDCTVIRLWRIMDHRLGGDNLAKSHYQFKKRQKELEKKKKKEEKRQRKLEKNSTEPEETPDTSDTPEDS
jgi:hypothetical protein